MNNIFKFSVIAGAALMFVSCNKWLDVMPDNRAELDSKEKISALLVSAYPTNSSFMMEEMASDNATDNGDKEKYESKSQEEAYLWEPIYTSDNDDAKSIWDACYGAIAAANHALAAIDEMGDPDDLSAQKGEALMCRAYAHFKLATLFCLPYNPATAETDLGLPYADVPETALNPKYTRGNLKDLFAKINADIEAGLPLVDDNAYSVPKYHFNRKAAYAFATRFNLYYHNLDKVIEYATEVVGSNPKNTLRDWAAIGTAASNWSVRVDMYIAASEQANLLMTTAYSSWGYWGGPYSLGTRYGHSYGITMNESVRAAGPWGTYSYLYPARNMWGLNPQKLCVTKIGGYFQYTDKVQGIGYRMNVNVQFTTDETLLCRAEAYIRKGMLEEGVADINAWLYTHTTNHKQMTMAQLVSWYKSKNFMPLEPAKDADRTVKKQINPVGFTLTEGDENQENLIYCILHLRRVEGIHEGLRWHDIKRYGIEISHPRDKQAADVLLKDDPRRAFQLPDDVIQAGLEANPR